MRSCGSSSYRTSLLASATRSIRVNDGVDKRLLAIGSAQAEQLRRDAVPDWAAGRQADTMLEVAKTDRVLYVDRHAFVELTRHHHQDIMGRTTMMSWAPGEPIGDTVLLEALKAGREAVAWCSRKVDLQSWGNDLRSRVRPWLAEGQKLRFIVEVEPEVWDGATPSFDDLWRTATPTLPRRPNSAKAQGIAAEPRLDTSPAEIARRIVRRFGAQLLVVAPPLHKPEEYSTGYALDEKTGLWRPGGDPWARWLRKIAEEMKGDAIQLGLRGAALDHTLAAVDRVKSTTLVENVRRHLRAELDELRDNDAPCPDVTECPLEDLDANTRYIGARNGMVDLHTARLLPPTEGRRRLVTTHVSVDYEPNATHPAVDRLFSHLGDKAATWWWKVLGRGLRGPTKRLYAGVGEPNGGKSTLLKALLFTLGPYARKAARGVLSAGNRASETQLTPGLLAWFSPVRFVLVEEEKRRQTLDAGLVKDLTGMGILSARGMRENLRQATVTATTIMFSNTDSVPRLSLETEGMQDRYRELPYVKVPVIDLAMSESVVQDPAFQTAFFARLVSWSARTPEPPADIPVVSEATRDRISEDMGEIGAFAQRIVPGGNVLTLDQAWRTWCEFVQAAPDESEAGGIKRLRFSSMLRDYVTGLPAPKLVSVGGKKMRGWRSWDLLTPEEAEAAAEQQAEETEQDYVPSPEAEEAIRDLQAGFPDDFSVLGVTLGRGRLNKSLVQLGTDAWLIWLRDEYKDGRQLVENLQTARDRVAFYDPAEDPTTYPNWIKLQNPDWDDGAVAEKWLYQTILGFALLIDLSRPAGPAYEQAQARFDSIVKPAPRESTALWYLFTAARQSRSVEADAEVLAQIAVDLVVEGTDPYQKWDRWFNADTEDAIRELLGLKEPSEARDYPGAASWSEANA